MSLSSHLVILGILCLTISCKFSEQPLYSFMVFDFSTLYYFRRIVLSTDEDKIAMISLNLSTFWQQQHIFNFDGENICSIQMLDKQWYSGWPSQTSGLYYNKGTLQKANSPCASPKHLLDLPQLEYDSSKTFTSSESFIAYSFGTSRLIEYNLVSGNISRQFKFNKSNERVQSIDYSPNHEYLYAVTKTNSSYKVVVFDARSGKRKTQINTEIGNLVKGLSDGSSFLCRNYTSDVISNVDSNGRMRQIWALSRLNDTFQYYVAICTNDDLLLAMRESGIGGDKKYEIIAYNTDDGSVSQIITLKFKPRTGPQQRDCNHKYLALMDVIGNVHIFGYSHVDQTQDRDANSDLLPHLQTQTRSKTRTILTSQQ